MKPYNQTESKKEQVRTMFDGIARRYDLLNHLLSLGIDRGWRRRVVRMVRLHRPAEILDMATGTGDLAIMLAEACPAAQITGIDLSERMLAIGREKVERKGLSGRIRLSQGDAETPRYGEGRFDAATVAFGVRNFEDLPGGMTGLVPGPEARRKALRAGIRYAAEPDLQSLLRILLSPGAAPDRRNDLERRRGLRLLARIGRRISLRETLHRNSPRRRASATRVSKTCSAA